MPLLRGGSGQAGGVRPYGRGTLTDGVSAAFCVYGRSNNARRRSPGPGARVRRRFLMRGKVPRGIGAVATPLILLGEAPTLRRVGDNGEGPDLAMRVASAVALAALARSPSRCGAFEERV